MKNMERALSAQGNWWKTDWCSVLSADPHRSKALLDRQPNPPKHRHVIWSADQSGQARRVRERRWRRTAEGRPRVGYA
jgi:hypothetical protein